MNARHKLYFQIENSLWHVVDRCAMSTEIYKTFDILDELGNSKKTVTCQRLNEISQHASFLDNILKVTSNQLKEG